MLVERTGIRFANHDIHIHVPAGATPKDGPSAGVAMVTALVSLLMGRAGPLRRRHDRGDHVEATGAADRRPEGEGAGRASATASRRVIAPALNEQDADDVPAHLRKDLEFVFVSTIDEVLDAALARRRVTANRVSY